MRSKARLGGALAAALAVTVVAGGSASAGEGDSAAKAQRGIDAEIEIKGGFQNLRFEGPEQITTGDSLTIRNLTQPGGQQGVGPHTFSLVQRDTRPVGNQEIKQCANFTGICAEIGEWHNVDQQGNVGDPDVDAGAAGWDKRGNFQHDGDTWYTETKDETTNRVVTAPAGRTIHYMCAIHPFMRGKFKTVAP